jgi:hypothetical protein
LKPLSSYDTEISCSSRSSLAKLTNMVADTNPEDE